MMLTETSVNAKSDQKGEQEKKKTATRLTFYKIIVLPVAPAQDESTFRILEYFKTEFTSLSQFMMTLFSCIPHGGV